MAVSDFLVIVFGVISLRIKHFFFPMSFLNITPVCSIVFVLNGTVTDCSVWFTVTFTFDRFIAICCPKLKTKYCTGEKAAMVLTTIGVLLFLRNIPYYFAYEPKKIIDNIPWFCRMKPSYYFDPGWVGFDWFDTVLTPLLPFAVILLLNALTIRYILVASRVRKGLRGRNKGENSSDPEMESRRRSMVLLFAISSTFILLWVTVVADFIYYQVRGSGGNYTESELIFLYVGYLLRNVSCCTNTFIYVITQSKFREQMKSAAKYPVTSVLRIIMKT
ncbi:probable G-protein coupled receptor 139 [Leucoraja erinacea]|uniref:probable G-protein coupled receptor 139 n=1 Tax=Leucoraja erinaceus TaxID=7782 RepID=UPI002457ED21|nr:probable G-protein coupled receptor 139 [Leucoraja erinacea]